MKKCNIRMIGIDLDGTLLTNKKEFLPYTKEILQKAITQGVLVMAATGRPYSGVPKELLEFPGIRYALTANGGRILDLEQNKTIYEQLVPVETARNVLEIFEHYDTLREIYYEGQGYAQADALARIDEFLPEKPMADYISKTRIPVPDIRVKFEDENRDLDKLQGLFTNIEDRDAALKELKQVPGIEVTGALEKNIEVNAKGVNKGDALLWLGEQLGIQREEIMAFGDGSNDIKMMQKAGVGVAMGNATCEVKNAADYIAASNEEEGVARFIEAYVLA